MDISLNLIDLQYLTNPTEMNKLLRNKNLSSVSMADLNFYKKRIFQLTKNMLRGKKITTKVDKAFENYARICIEHFKFIDKMEIIQKDYENITVTTKETKSFNIEKSNSIMMKKKKPYRPKITDNIKIKTNRVVKPPIIPKQRTFNLKDPRFREKGLKKENINNI